ncbi:transporter substrate-binding domain-containing protein [Roseateles asaccharophilus]|uniref:Polar amino acid transport system substrate-binding protein n=1 Tax=Roseateles asaccharophilus TaxID=582607 RepID=A0ABU2A5M1_9BURK|nr:transporter substrate-binding domain-containing protein [Roseateles asaccharophilus]MDR7332486.1 polar amino acid transport system substrate-binding protein [Roseateles asaccharophilus]
MLSRRTLPLTLASLLGGASGLARATKPVWVCHDVPPYLWQGPKGLEGYAFTLYQRVMKQAGMAPDLQCYPFARAFRMLETGQAQAALVVTRSPDREARFRWLYPVGRFRFGVFTRVTSGAVPTTVNELKAYRVGSLRASTSRAMLESAGAQIVVEGKDYAELLTLLNRGIVDAVIGPESVLRSTDTSGGEGLRITTLDKGHDFYTAASMAMSEAAAQRVRAAYQQLVEAGVVAQLRKAHPEAVVPD